MKSIKFKSFIVLLMLLMMVGISWAQTPLVTQTTGFEFHPEQAKKTPYVVALSNFTVGNSWRLQMVAEFKAFAAMHPDLIKQAIVTNANNSVPKQIADIQDLIARRIDLIVVDAGSTTALNNVLNSAVSAGIPVVAFDNLPTTPNLTAYVNVSNVEWGRETANWLIKKLGGKGNIIMLNGIAGTSTNTERADGALEVFKQYPGIKILAEVNAGWDFAKAKTAVQSLLSTYPNISGVWSQGGAMTEAAVEDFVNAKHALVPMTGEGNNGFLKIWDKYRGQGFSSIAPSAPTYMSAISLAIGLNMLRGMPYYKFNLVQPPLITDKNLKQYVRPDLADSFWNLTILPKAATSEMFKNK